MLYSWCFTLVAGVVSCVSASTVLVPLPPNHPTRLATASTIPIKTITLNYWEIDSTRGRHYEVRVNFIFNAPAVVVKDLPGVWS